MIWKMPLRVERKVHILMRERSIGPVHREFQGEGQGLWTHVFGGINQPAYCSSTLYHLYL